MTSFSYICIVWLTFCVGLLSAEAEITVSGQVGSTAVLLCELQPVGTETLHIRWSIESKIVFERYGEESYRGEGYEGRVDVPEEELRKGNCSLVLQNLSLNDADVYTSYQMTGTKRSVMTTREEISRVKLSVYEKPEERKDPSTPSTFSGEAGINCPHLLILIISLFMCFLFSR